MDHLIIVILAAISYVCGKATTQQAVGSWALLSVMEMKYLVITVIPLCGRQHRSLVWLAHSHIFSKWQKWDRNSSQCLKAFNPFCSLFICILTLLNYVVFIFSLTQGQHHGRTSGFNILSTNSSESVPLKGFCQQLTLWTASKEGKSQTEKIWNWHILVTRGQKLVLFLQNELFAVKLDHQDNLQLSLSTSGFQIPGRRSQSLRSCVYIITLVRPQQNGEDLRGQGQPETWSLSIPREYQSSDESEGRRAMYES